MGVALGTSGALSSSARAALQTTSRGDASPAGWSATARGSGTGTRCSDRIRGQRAAIGLIEMEGVSDEVISGFTGHAAPRERSPGARPGGRHREAAHDARIEAAEPASRWIGDEPGERRHPAWNEKGRERGGIARVACRDTVHGVERHEIRSRYSSSEAAAQVRPNHAMRREAEARAKQLPGRAGAVIGAPLEPLFMTRQSLGELPWQSRERQPVAPVSPQHIAARAAAPRGDVSTANCWPGARTFTVE